MSVIIEGLTLPKHNPKEIDKNVLIGYAIVKEDNTAELCLEGVHYLIKMLPTPHGRLIDAVAVEKRLQKYWYEEYPNQEASYRRAFMDSNACVKDLPTIIEAEVKE